MELKGDAELKGIESANLSLKAVVRGQVPGSEAGSVLQADGADCTSQRRFSRVCFDISTFGGRRSSPRLKAGVSAAKKS